MPMWRGLLWISGKVSIIECSDFGHLWTEIFSQFGPVHHRGWFTRTDGVMFRVAKSAGLKKEEMRPIFRGNLVLILTYSVGNINFKFVRRCLDPC